MSSRFESRPDGDPASWPNDEFFDDGHDLDLPFDEDREPEWFVDYLDGTLSSEERARYDARLSDDAELAQRFDSYRERVALLRSMGAAERRVDGGTSLRDRILADAQRQIPAGRGHGFRFAWASSVTLAAASLVLFFALQGSERDSTPADDVARVPTTSADKANEAGAIAKGMKRTGVAFDRVESFQREGSASGDETLRDTERDFDAKKKQARRGAARLEELELGAAEGKKAPGAGGFDSEEPATEVLADTATPNDARKAGSKELRPGAKAVRKAGAKADPSGDDDIALRKMLAKSVVATNDAKKDDAKKGDAKKGDAKDIAKIDVAKIDVAKTDVAKKLGERHERQDDRGRRARGARGRGLDLRSAKGANPVSGGPSSPGPKLGQPGPAGPSSPGPGGRVARLRSDSPGPVSGGGGGGPAGKTRARSRKAEVGFVASPKLDTSLATSVLRIDVPPEQVAVFFELMAAQNLGRAPVAAPQELMYFAHDPADTATKVRAQRVNRVVPGPSDYLYRLDGKKADVLAGTVALLRRQTWKPHESTLYLTLPREEQRRDAKLAARMTVGRGAAAASRPNEAGESANKNANNPAKSPAKKDDDIDAAKREVVKYAKKSKKKRAMSQAKETEKPGARVQEYREPDAAAGRDRGGEDLARDGQALFAGRPYRFGGEIRSRELSRGLPEPLRAALGLPGVEGKAPKKAALLVYVRVLAELQKTKPAPARSADAEKAKAEKPKPETKAKTEKREKK